MHKNGSSALTSAALLSMLVLGCQSRGSETDPSKMEKRPISGVVSFGGKPLANKELRIMGPLTGTATTNQDGKFEKVILTDGEGLIPGEYMVEVDIPGKGIGNGMFTVDENTTEAAIVVKTLADPGGPGGPIKHPGM